jgi:hypothetical protein
VFCVVVFFASATTFLRTASCERVAGGVWSGFLAYLGVAWPQEGSLPAPTLRVSVHPLHYMRQALGVLQGCGVCLLWPALAVASAPRYRMVAALGLLHVGQQQQQQHEWLLLGCQEGVGPRRGP